MIPERREGRFGIDTRTLAELLSSGASYRATGFPDVSELAYVRAAYVFESDQVQIIMRHHSFDIVAEGCIIPYKGEITLVKTRQY